MNSTLRIDDHPVIRRNPAPAKVTITVDGRDIPAFEGEPVAAAMLAVGIRAVRTMPETGEPRGVFTGVGRSIEELGTVNGESNLPLIATLVRDGMVVETQSGLGQWGAKL